MPRYIYLLHANDESESDITPTHEKTEILTKMLEYNKALSEAGLFFFADGFRSSNEGARVIFSDSKTTNVQNGPFDREGLIRGFWVVRAKDLDEAVAWAKKVPVEDTVIEVRRLGEIEDFQDAMTEDLKRQFEGVGAKAAENAKAA
ncbi:uncharacterized protein A1O9_12019 [Exophiala aquamarina CBS 119918]|uniref:YCII-related domain-containing protein n=1 Tax=Exophiala aquamarina CBS 119918 TaxID=1182545 RepID=A0A072NVY0_9EURO|nr:uncharacterized protein A1O9_12019 [Exophiala aquamarina CBS 119918]KEF52029.1 hypothetical protein A1O9_12019 [Exophiala aquamarina CBS 119918]